MCAIRTLRLRGTLSLMVFTIGVPLLVGTPAFAAKRQAQQSDTPTPDRTRKLDQRPDVPAWLAERTPSALMAAVTQPNRREAVLEEWPQDVMTHSGLAQRLNYELYPNPNLQAFVNAMGQMLIPTEASSEVMLSFKLVNDPVPEAYALSTGTVFVSTGLISMLENESQLAYIVAHEASHVLLSHHLYTIIEDVNRDARAKKRTAILSILGGIAGAAVGGSDHAAGGAAIGASVGFIAGSASRSIGSTRGAIRFGKELEAEADLLASELILRASYDLREVPGLMARMETVLQGSPEIGMSFVSDKKNLEARRAALGTLISGCFRDPIDAKLNQGGFQMISPRFNQLMSELKRDNGLMALDRDLFAIARANLEEAAAIRTDDPLTMYGLGRFYRATGRTPEERAKAASYFRNAIKMDEGRSRFPEAHLEYAVELINLESSDYYPEIQHALKTYVVLYQRTNTGMLPPEMTFVYDYLDLAGDRTWLALPVDNVNTDPPYQALPDPGLHLVKKTPAKKP